MAARTRRERGGQSFSQRRLCQRFRPFLQALEARTLLNAVLWTGGGDGTSWSDARNWSGNARPGAADDVTINVTGNISVVHSSNDDSIHSLTSQNALALSGGSLSVAAASTVGNVFPLSGGTLAGGGTATITGTMNWTGGTMSGAGTTAISSGATL